MSVLCGSYPEFLSVIYVNIRLWPSFIIVSIFCNFYHNFDGFNLLFRYLHLYFRVPDTVKIRAMKCSFITLEHRHLEDLVGDGR